MLINCVAYQEGMKLADIAVEDISEYVGRPDCFVWVALRDATDDELEVMQREFGLHDLAVERQAKFIAEVVEHRSIHDVVARQAAGPRARHVVGEVDGAGEGKYFEEAGQDGGQEVRVIIYPQCDPHHKECQPEEHVMEAPVDDLFEHIHTAI